ncbi:schwannomin-interacting protein 1 [Grus japonensis]|uniref:Schwannomin-interacting protein 1 n=1 Tax=Grus japonensis TaxID=30415 RepID=A0ABC9X7Z9_GRUJA
MSQEGDGMGDVIRKAAAPAREGSYKKAAPYQSTPGIRSGFGTHRYNSRGAIATDSELAVLPEVGGVSGHGTEPGKSLLRRKAK